jgi:GNAT superfamily N-acetyltransferase
MHLLDKSVPFVDVLMHRKSNQPLPLVSLPAGYSFVSFQPGDEKAWAQIEASVLEFDSEIHALLRFQRDYLPYLSELERRCIFIQSDAGEKVATATAWWSYTGNRRDPWIHWVAVKPTHQGKGLGKAVVAEIIRRMIEIEGDRDIYLHTQTWSHKAIKIYQKAGFVITSQPNLYKYSNHEYERALAILAAIDNNQPIPL